MYLDALAWATEQRRPAETPKVRAPVPERRTATGNTLTLDASPR
jgi:hypothetical protein